MISVYFDYNKPAAYQMAADYLALMRAEPLIRFYTWRPAAISLGYMQKPQQALNMQALHDQGVAWIRRPTGGRAVYHVDELTYSIVLPLSWQWVGLSVMQTYRTIAEALLEGFRYLGINAGTHGVAPDTQASRRELNDPCFLTPGLQEIMVDGRKLVGSAQKRTDTAILQHGSIPLKATFSNLPFLQNVDAEQAAAQANALRSKCCWIQDVDPKVGVEQLAKGLLEGFKRSLPVPVVLQQRTATSIGQIEQCMRSERFIEFTQFR